MSDSALIDGGSVQGSTGVLDITVVESKIGYVFADKDILRRALTHRSSQEALIVGNYELLEFLGDVVIDLVVTDLLIKQNPKAQEGELSKMRAALVNTSLMADVARLLELGKCVRVGKGELCNGAVARSGLLADVLESIMGAVYTDGGYGVAYSVIAKVFADKLEGLMGFEDPKTQLQERTQSGGLGQPQYVLECVEGPEHSAVFVSCVLISDKVVARGSGDTKKSSEKAAAKEALSVLEGECRYGLSSS